MRTIGASCVGATLYLGRHQLPPPAVPKIRRIASKLVVIEYRPHISRESPPRASSVHTPDLSSAPARPPTNHNAALPGRRFPPKPPRLSAPKRTGSRLASYMGSSESRLPARSRP